MIVPVLNRTTILAMGLLFVLYPLVCCGQNQTPRDKMVIGDRDELLGNDFWIYDDLDKAIEIAKREKKPLLVTLRCIP